MKKLIFIGIMGAIMTAGVAQASTVNEQKAEVQKEKQAGEKMEKFEDSTLRVWDTLYSDKEHQEKYILSFCAYLRGQVWTWTKLHFVFSVLPGRVNVQT